MEEEWINDDDVIVKRRASHIRACCAAGCTSKGYRLLIEGERVQYFPFPLYDQDLCQRWAAAVRLPGDAPFEKSYVCSKHFRPSDYKSRLFDDYKKALRRTSIPSLEPVVALGKTPKKRPAADKFDGSSDYSTEEDEEFEEEMPANILPIMTKNASDGDNFNVFMVKKSEPAAQSDDEDIEKPAVLKEHKTAMLLCQNLLNAGEPYPWKKEGLDAWVTERTTSHLDRLEKIRDAMKEEENKINLLQEQLAARREILAMVIIKKTMGRMGLSQFLRTLH